MALLRGRLLAGALFAGTLFGLKRPVAGELPPQGGRARRVHLTTLSIPVPFALLDRRRDEEDALLLAILL